MTNPRLFFRSALTVALAASFAAYAFAAEVAKKSYQLPAGDAAVTLKRFSEQSGEQIVYPFDAVRGVQTKAVSGQLTAREALDQMLAGTTLVTVQDDRTQALAVQIAAAPRAVAIAGTGTIEGRVFNPASGSFVNNARVTIEALKVETFTDEYGQYRFTRVPTGAAVVRVFYTGFPAEAQTVQVTGGLPQVQDFTLHASKEPASDGPVKLDAYTVAAQRDMSASDVAVNEQRYSAAIKNIVATDSFGDIAEGNVGEFAKFLPGVTLNRDGSDGRSISLGGVPPSATPIMVDGNPLASAASSSGSRTVELEQMSITGMSRVEITRSPGPDSPGNAIGGTVNLISRSAFERATPQYLLKTYLSFKGGDFSFKEKPNPFAKKTYPFEPNLEVSAVVPVTKNFGFTASGLVTRALANGQGSLMSWVPGGIAQSTSYIASTPDKPYLARYRLQERPKISVRESLSLTADWRLSQAGVLTLGFQYAYFNAEFWVRQLNFDVGRVASFGPDFTQGAAGAGFAQIIYDSRQKDGTTYVPSFRYKHNGPVWQWQVNGAYGRASNHYRNLDKGYFQTNNAYFRNLTVRFEQMNFDHPGVVSLKDSAGREVDPYSLNNYKMESVQGTSSDGVDIVRSISGFAKRDLNLRLPFSLKAGADLRSQHRDLREKTYGTSFVGADRVAQSADDNAYQWYDPVYSTRPLLFGNQRMQWLDASKFGDTFRAHPEYFNRSATNEVNNYRSDIVGSQVITETIAAPYLRFDTKLMDGRLLLTGGVRYERTSDVGAGAHIDPSLTYQRDSAGRIVRDSSNRPVVIAAIGTLAGSKLAYLERAQRVDTHYGDYFPSLTANYNITTDLLARVSYGKSIRRPEFDDILPTATIPDPAGTGRTIEVSNPALKPWKADSYSVALEYYFNEASSGQVSARLYRRDITDFWGATVTPATDALLEPWGLDPSVYGEALGYQVSMRSNVGAARVTGMEFDYRQNLTFLPHWARGFTLFGNLTMQHLKGNQMASFTNFVGKTTNWGIAFSRSRFTVRLAVNLKGLVKQGQVTNAGVAPGTYTYLLPRRSADLTAEYRFTRKVSVFVSGRNINEAVDDTVIYGPTTPSDRILSGRADYRAYWNVGLKAIF